MPALVLDDEAGRAGLAAWRPRAGTRPAPTSVWRIRERRPSGAS